MKLTKQEVNHFTKALYELQLLHDLLEERIEARNNKYYERSEKWQESEKGCEFQEVTEALEDFNNEIDSALMLDGYDIE